MRSLIYISDQRPLSTSLLALGLTLLCSGCPALHEVEVPPPPLDPQISAARVAFRQGDWARLRELAVKLPGEGEFAVESRLYQAVIVGLGDAKRGEQLIKEVESQTIGTLRERASFYLLIFKARQAECLLTEGPLKKIYQPKIDDLGPGAKVVLGEALQTCAEVDEARRARITALQAPPKAQRSEPEQVKDPSPQADDSTPAVPKTLNQLTTSERQGVEPYLQLWSPKSQSPQDSITYLKQRLHESAPLLTDDRERRGEILKIEEVEVELEGEISPQAKADSLRDEVDVIIALAQTEALQAELLAASQVARRPLFLWSPLEVKQESESDPQVRPPVWRIHLDLRLVARQLVEIAADARAQSVGVLYPEISGGEKILELIKGELAARGVKFAYARGVNESSDWAKIAEEVRGWPVDTLIFASLRSTSVGTAVSHLAARGVWSTPPSSFNTPQKLSAESPQEELYRRYLLWPSAYAPQTLQQAGRYLNGARTVTPVYVESEAFQELNRRCKRELGRDAGQLDAIFLDLFESIDEAIRLGESRQKTLVEALMMRPYTQRFTLPFDFSQPQIIQRLFQVEVREQAFSLIERDQPKEAPEEVTESASEEDPKEAQHNTEVGSSARSAEGETTQP